MHSRSFLNICFTLLFGAILLGARVGASPTDTRDLSNPANALEARGNIGSTVSLLEDRTKKPPKKFRKAVQGTCKKKRSVEQLVKRQTLAELYETITKADDKAGVGATKHWPLTITTAAAFTTSEFYGCTVVVIVNGKGVIIGHFSEVGSNCIAMDNANEVAKITDKLLDGLAMLDLDSKSMAYIIHTSSETSVGVKAIKDLLKDCELPEERIKQHRYSPSSGVGGFPGQPKGKAVVQWTPKTDGGATLKVYIEKDAPTYIGEFDATENLCSETIS